MSTIQVKLVRTFCGLTYDFMTEYLHNRMKALKQYFL